MKKNLTFMIIGGDCRFSYMQAILEAAGFGVKRIYPGIYRADDFEKTEVFVLPVPLTRDGRDINAPLAGEPFPIKDFLRLLPKKSIVAGGLISQDLTKELESRGATVFDYYRDSQLTLKNAVPTAEGVIGILINSLPVTIEGMKCAVTGYGRCGRALCQRLLALGAEVTVAARSEEALALAKKEGMSACPISELSEACSEFEAVVNTVPALVIDREVIMNLREDCLLCEVASAPFGIDFEAAAERGSAVIKAGSLPGRTAPMTAGKIICETLLRFIQEVT